MHTEMFYKPEAKKKEISFAIESPLHQQNFTCPCV